MRLPELASGVRWGVCVRELPGGDVLLVHEPDAVLRTASIGKLLLLVAVAEDLAAGALDRGALLERSGVEPVADSGLWQHLEIGALPLADVAALVGAVSDNLATNVLLHHVGLRRVARAAQDRGLRHTALHDAVRDARGPEHPPTLSTGTAAELASLVSVLPVQVRSWLALGTDLSMVAGAFGLDPLAHTGTDRGVRLVNKTGTDEGVRADVGLVEAGERSLAYAVLAAWDPAEDLRDPVLASMRAIGGALRAALQPE